MSALTAEKSASVVPHMESKLPTALWRASCFGGVRKEHGVHQVVARVEDAGQTRRACRWLC
eukprot:12998532-Alexandrium_andersonii.AAC.1